MIITPIKRRLFQRWPRTATGIISLSTAVVGCGSIYYCNNDVNFPNSETVMGIQRQSQFWIGVGPIIFDYYWNFSSLSPKQQFRHAWSSNSRYIYISNNNDEKKDTGIRRRKKEEEDRAKLLMKAHQRHAVSMLELILQLKGLYIKLGQVLSVTALPIPEAYRIQFRTLQSDVSGYEDFETVIIPTLERELNVQDITQIFTSIDPIPCGAASIGQAHRAKLITKNDNGEEEEEEVVVKVQYSDASWKIQTDIQCVHNFLRICVYAGVVDNDASKLSFQEFSRQFMAELDYDSERRNLKEVHQSSISTDAPYMKHGVVVPKVYDDRCTSRVITMSYLPGPKLEAEAKRQLQLLGIDTSQGIRGAMMMTKNGEKNNALSTGAIDDDVVDDEQLLKKNSKNQKRIKESFTMQRILLLFLEKCVGIDSLLWLTRRVTRWWTAITVITAKKDDIGNVEVSLRTTESWIDALLNVHGHQIFILGLFNADPHPGNIILVDNDTATNHLQQQNNNNSQQKYSLGLIDYGQCKRLSLEERVKVARLVLSVANNNNDDEMIAKAFRELGVRTKHDSTEFLATLAKLMFGKFEVQHLDHAWHQRLHKIDRILYFPNELAMVYRTSLLLRGLAISLQMNPSICHHWKHHAQTIVDQYNNNIIIQSNKNNTIDHTRIKKEKVKEKKKLLPNVAVNTL